MDAHIQQEASREEMIAYLLDSPYIFSLPITEQGTYLFGKTSNNRAVCLAWHGENNGQINRQVLLDAVLEVQRAGLFASFLFFGITKVLRDEVFTFAQLPLSGDRDTAIFYLLQAMRLHGVLRPIRMNA